MVDSPCTSVCALDDGVCVGCGRTLAEIASWGSLSDEEREEIVRAIQNSERAYPKSD